jgi:hypothetical protein
MRVQKSRAIGLESCQHLCTWNRSFLAPALDGNFSCARVNRKGQSTDVKLVGEFLSCGNIDVAVLDQRPNPE